MNVTAFLLGFGLGAFSSGVYFGGLYKTVRTGLCARRPTTLLALSAVARMGLFLTVGFFVTRMGLESGLGFFAAFPLVRYVAISWGGKRLDGLRIG